MLVRRIDTPYTENETSPSIAPLGTLGVVLGEYRDRYFVPVAWKFNGILYHGLKWARPYFTLVDCPITEAILRRKLGI